MHPLNYHTSILIACRTGDAKITTAYSLPSRYMMTSLLHHYYIITLYL